MRARPDIRVIRGILLAVLVSALPQVAHAQEGEGDDGQAEEDGEIDLVYEREVFDYPAATSRDPFLALTRDGAGARLEDLTLKGIIYSPGASVALLVDGDGGKYRLRSGDIVGNARVVEIRRSQVRFAVEDFGVVHQEVLELQRTRSEGAER